MRSHLLMPAGLFAMLLTAALSTGSMLLFVLALMVALTVIICLASVIWASATVRITAEMEEQTVYRGEHTTLVLGVSHGGWIPVAPVILEIPSMSGGENRKIRLKDIPGRVQSLRMPIDAAHVGIYTSGIKTCMIEDLLGLFQRVIHPDETEYSLTVLPRVFDVDPLVMAPGDPGSELMARANEDLSAPSDVRAYQPGDAMKKIHWKLSIRKRELIVRKFEEPLMQEVLILMDCSRPPFRGDLQAEADIRDALLETAASLFSAQMRTDHEIRMPLTGSRPAEADRSIGTTIAMKYLAGVDFSETDRFERVLQMESSRMSKVGCVAVVTARLNYAMVDIMTRIHRTGPNLRLYLVTYTPDDANVLPLISRLQHSGIEVAYVTPNA
jgi:uncharacterized protein (DUF58 family)